MIERLRAAHLSKLPISLRDEQHAVVSSLTDSKEAPRYLIIPGGDAATASAGGGEDEVDLFSPSGYASHPAITVLHFLQNMHLDHPSYVQQTVALAEQFGRDIPSIGLLERRDLVDYLTGVSSTSTRIITSSSSSHSSKSGITSSATASLPVSSLDPMDVDNDDVASAKKRPKLMVNNAQPFSKPERPHSCTYSFAPSSSIHACMHTYIHTYRMEHWAR